MVKKLKLRQVVSAVFYTDCGQGVKASLIDGFVRQNYGVQVTPKCKRALKNAVSEGFLTVKKRRFYVSPDSFVIICSLCRRHADMLMARRRGKRRSRLRKSRSRRRSRRSRSRRNRGRRQTGADDMLMARRRRRRQLSRSRTRRTLQSRRRRQRQGRRHVHIYGVEVGTEEPVECDSNSNKVQAAITTTPSYENKSPAERPADENSLPQYILMLYT